MKVVISETGSNKLSKALGQLSKFTKSPTRVLKIAGGLMRQDIDTHFRNQAGPSGKWKPLSRMTLSRRGKNAKILQDKGRLRGSITYMSNDKRAEAGTNTRYGLLHQSGGYTTINGQRKYVPARPFIWLSKSAEQRITTYFLNELKANS